uniref:Contactin-associated protein-like 4 n=1 Tax=Dermatophagoides pteronyssinus TaxID=6956 RepID=A0A6P6Y5E7_DERPT|nr:contactin-associated protein-like 4 [Dermatophagoides pteronyssinus]
MLFYESYYLLNDQKNAIFELFLTIQNGRFKVLIVNVDDSNQSLNQQSPPQELIIGHSFHHDNLHTVKIFMNLELGFFNVRINSTNTTTTNNKYYKSLYFNATVIKPQYDKRLNFQLILGSHSFEPKLSTTSRSGSSWNIRKFIGCIGNVNIISRSSVNNFDTLSSSELNFINITDGCVDQCQKNLCSRRSRCMNFYDTKKCNCFGTELEDSDCRSFNYTVMTFRGYSSLSYKIYSFIDKYYSDDNLISLHLKTRHNGLLFLAISEIEKSYLIINIKNEFLNLLFDLGNNNPKNYIFNNYRLTDNEWHNITVHHLMRKIHVYIDNINIQIITLDSIEPYFYFDPEVYVGGFPSNLNVSQLDLPFYLANKKFVGCLKHLYFNHHNILYDLNMNSKKARYFSQLPREFGCHQIDSIPMTFYSRSYFKTRLNQTSSTTSKSFSIKFQFKTFVDKFSLVKGKFNTVMNSGTKKWSLSVRNEDVKLIIEDDDDDDDTLATKQNKLKWTLSNDNSLNITEWNSIDIIFKNNGLIEMIVNLIDVKGRYDSSVDFFHEDILFGSFDDQSKFIGCVRELIINENHIEPRTLREQTSQIFGKISLDNCQLVNPCHRPKACEHDGRCIATLPYNNGTYSCDCSNTGYIGRTCHFSLYRKSCEEIYLMDKQTSGIYMIDLDRNGPTQPAHVYCDISATTTAMNGSNNKTTTTTMINTVIEHNIQHQVIVREKGQQNNQYMDVYYRDFSREMLRLFVQRSDQCKQYIRYECNNVPLSLSTYTILYAIKPEHKLLRLDSSKQRGCSCSSENRRENKCIDPSLDCNCDSVDIPGWKNDDGYLTDKNDVGITRMFFLRFPNSSLDSEAHLFLGNLSCQDLDTQKYEITFKTKESYLEVPGWNGREMAISFKTTANRAVIFFQSHLETTTTYFKATIISEKEISFEYCLRNRKFNVTVASSRCLNCGQWQYVLVERDDTQMRVSINQNFKILYLNENDHFIDFDGKLYVGGAPIRYLRGLKITLGFIGCLRGLVLDDTIVNLHQYLSATRYPNIESGCRPYCRPNLCQNQAICVELWGSYQCRCANPIAHSGRNCEININENAITLKSPTYLRKEFSTDQIKTILKQDIVLSFRTHESYALLLFIHDGNRNFLQIHIADGRMVILSYNYHQKIIVRKIDIGRTLTNGQPVQIQIARHSNHTVFTVNKKNLIIPLMMQLVMKDNRESIHIDSSSMIENENDQLIEFKPEVVIGKNQIFIGGIPDADTELINSIPGFVGCIQGFRIGDRLFDLEQWATEIHQQEQNQTDRADRIKIGCKMLCDNIPCNNGGSCTENWQQETFNCDCNYTSYRGEKCDIDIGAHFEKPGSNVIYYLDKKIWDFNHIDISFAFSSSSSTNTDEGATLFMIRYANSTRFLHLALFPNGKMFVEEDDGHEIYSKIIESEEDNFSDSYRHWVRYQRDDKSAQIIVDSIIFLMDEHYKEYEKLVPNTDENIIVIGSSRINQQNFSSLPSFRGCISNINIILDDLKIDPFESAFGIRSGLSDVKVNGPIKQGICAAFRQQQKTNTPLMMRTDQTLTSLNRVEIWLNRPKPSLIPFKMKNDENSEPNYMSKSNIVIIISIIYLTIVFICVAIYLWKIDKRYRLLKFQGETPFFHKNQMKIEKSYM